MNRRKRSILLVAALFLVVGSQDVVIDGLRGDAAPSSPDKAPVRLRDGKGGRVENVRPARER